MIDSLNNTPNIATAFFEIAEKYPDRMTYSQSEVSAGEVPGKPREWKGRANKEVAERIKRTAHFLKSTGFRRGDKAAILSSSRPEWMEADIAILALGGVTVSVYQSLPYDDVGYILFDSDAEYVFAENQEQVDKLLELLKGPIAIPATEERDTTQAQIGIKKIIAFDPVASNDLVSHFSDVVAGEEPSANLTTVSEIPREDLAALVYTSGTTGPPKGVMQSHANHLSNVRQAWEARLVEPHSAILLFLPLAHSFARLMGYLGFLTPAQIRFPGIADRSSSKTNMESVSRDLTEAGATVVPVVPRLLEKMQAGVQQKAAAPGIEGKLVSAVIWSSRSVYASRLAGKPPSLLASVTFSLTAGIRRKIKAKLFGEKFEFAVSGGAKLNPQVAIFFDALEVEIIEGYGLTETCVATNVNRPGSKKIGTVGPALADDIELRLGEDGEIMYRGPNIALGYYRRDAATKSSWDSEGWFHTGDLGSVDEDGFLTIVGRKKEIIVTSYGKNIAPEDIEALIKSTPYVSQALLIGDGRAYCVALVTADAPAVAVWAKKHGVNANGAELLKDSRVKNLIWKDVEEVNGELASYETVKKVAIVPEEFTVDNGFLTPTFKIKRRMVEQEYKEMIESLYSS